MNTQVSIDLSASPVRGEVGPTYQSFDPSRVIALTPSTSVTLGVSTSAVKSPSSVPLLVMVASSPRSAPVRSISTIGSTSAIPRTSEMLFPLPSFQSSDTSSTVIALLQIVTSSILPCHPRFLASGLSPMIILLPRSCRVELSFLAASTPSK